MSDKNIAIAQKIAAAVRAAGGKTYYVGGYVRDLLLGRENKDIDIEIHGISVKTLEGILDSLGERTSMGASFGIMGLKHYDIDIAMPRSEITTGRGHKDFEVFVDPFIGEQRAALRRDFTMNALMQDVLTGEILDFFGGRADMAAGLIRHVNDLTYVEDPLRVLRAAQFAARFEYEVAADTAALSSKVQLDALARERVMGELEKALMKARRPSVFFEQLKRMRQLSIWFHELEALSEAKWRDAMATLDAAACYRSGARHPLEYMLTAMCAVPEAPRALALLTRLTSANTANRYLTNMAEARQSAASAPLEDIDCWMAIYDASICPEDLLLLLRAERHGDAGWAAMEGRARELLTLYRERMNQPYVMGRDLIDAGAKPGTRMGEALALAHRLRLYGKPKAEQLEAALRLLQSDEAGI